MEEIQKKLAKAVEELFDVKVDVKVTPAPANTGADYASNIAMQLAKLVHKAPMVIAEMLKDEFSERSTSSEIASPGGFGFVVEVAQPGFLNFKVNEEALIEKARNYATSLAEEVADRTYAGKTVVAEFSDPNPFKVLHVGHLYTSIVGDSISRLLEFAGAKVVRANFGGDVGLHVAKTLYALGLNKEVKPTIEDIAKCYVEGTKAYEEDEAAKAEITKLNKEIYRINAEDIHGMPLADLYWRGRELSYQYFDDFYARIGVKFDKYYPESSVADRGVREVRAHTGTTYEESDGAIVYKGEKVGLHTRVFINREGVPTYETKDVGLIFTKWDNWHFDESIVVTGNEQTDYMRVVLASVSEYAPQLVERTTHLTHGLVKLPGNVKMSSRKGNFLKAVDVIQIVSEQLNGTVSDTFISGHDVASARRCGGRASSSSVVTSGDSLDKKSEAVPSTDEHLLTMAAIKYAFLKYKMGGDIIFDPQESVSTTGNSGIYLLYSSVRAKKILQKCQGERVVGENTEDNSKEKIFERNLSKKIVQYKDVLKEAVSEKAPYKICTYLYELSQEFSRFYENVKVAGNTREKELAKLVQAYLKVMEHGLDLLGIKIPESM